MGFFGRKKGEGDEPATGATATEEADLAAAVPETAAGAPAAAAGETIAEATRRAHVFGRPEAVSASRHGKLRIRRSAAAYGFARKTHLIPLALQEFPLAAQHYPIVFAGENRTPCAAMGLRDGENVIIDESGLPENDVYLPAFLRQYPFLLAHDAKTDRAILFIDRDSDHLSETEGEPLFEGDEPSAFSKTAMNFLVTLRRQRLETEAFVAKLQSLDLFEQKDVLMRSRDEAGGEPKTRPLVKYVSIAPEKIDALSAEALRDLGQPGYLQGVYAQQLSLYTWNRLVDRTIRRRAAAAAG